jgi:hypothetical protein
MEMEGITRRLKRKMNLVKGITVMMRLTREERRNDFLRE